jgi:hypothetical protein
MAARKTRFDPSYIREKIQTQQLIRRLTEHVNGEVKLEASQVTAALGLLKKVTPDLSATEHSGEVKRVYVARLPEKAKTADEWQQQHSPTIQ